MADPEQLERLKRSVQEWNTWRQEHFSSVRPNLSDTLLNSVDLRGADLRGSDLNSTDLGGADLRGAGLNSADLNSANLTSADLSSADLSNVNFSFAHLSHTDLSSADLSIANLSHARLIGASFNQTKLFHTLFAWVDLSQVKDLETASHNGPSSVDINSIILPHDESIRNHFLRGVGFTETQIEYLPSLLTPRPIQYHSLFISYAHQDEIFATRLHTDLRKSDVPCWFAPHELIPGDYYRHKIDKAINHHDKLVLILSQYSVKSQWVEKEVETALKREDSMNMDQQVLFPIRLDDTVMTTSRRWISSLRYHRHIGDFTGWQDDVAYRRAFTTLLRHLKVT